MWRQPLLFLEVTHMNEVFTDLITEEEYMQFRKEVGWAEFPLEQAREGLKNSFIRCLRIDGKPIALGRVIWDHGYVVYIADIIVKPEYQGKGYGKEALLRRGGNGLAMAQMVVAHGDKAVVGQKSHEIAVTVDMLGNAVLDLDDTPRRAVGQAFQAVNGVFSGA